MSAVMSRIANTLRPGDYVAMSESEYRSLHAIVAGVLGFAEGSDRALIGLMNDLSEETLDQTIQEVRLLLGHLGYGHEVKVLWPYSRLGILLSQKALIRHLDELWLPGSDDLWILDEQPTSLIVLDHEERLASYRLPVP